MSTTSRTASRHSSTRGSVIRDPTDDMSQSDTRNTESWVRPAQHLISEEPEHAAEAPENGAPQMFSNILRQASGFMERKVVGEGPAVLRGMCFGGGLATVVVSFISSMNILKLMLNTTSYVLQICVGLLGIVVMAIESKDVPCFSELKDFCHYWAKFLTVPAGKGGLYTFLGLLLVSQGFVLGPTFLTGAYMILVGMFCIGVHITQAQAPSNPATTPLVGRDGGV